MKVFTARLQSASSYSQSRFHDTPKLNKEGPDDYDLRTWPLKMHTTDDGFVFIPPEAFKFGLDATAKYLGLKIPGQRNKTWTQKFVSGVSVAEPLVLDLKAEDVKAEKIFVNADGVRGSGKRVFKWFPMIPEWEGDVRFYVFDETITRDPFVYHLKQFGAFIGIGRYRPQVGGWKGRFRVLDVKEEEIAEI